MEHETNKAIFSEHYFKGDVKKKIKFVYHHKYQLHINENDNEIYLWLNMQTDRQLAI